MRKEVEKMKRYGLIGLMLLVILATPAMAQTLNKGPIGNSSLGITSAKLSDTNYTYGSNVELTVTWSYYKAEDYGSRYIAIIDWSTYTTKVKPYTGDAFVANASDPSNYKWLISLPEDAGSQTYSINTAEKNMFPSYYVVVIFNTTGAYDDRLVFIVEPVAGKPYVSITTDRMTAALGDRVELKYKMTASENYYVGVLVTGWEGKVYFQNCSVGTWTLYPWMAPMANFDEDRCVAICMAAGKTKSECENGLKFFPLTSAYGFKNTTEGYIVFKIAAGKDPYNLFTGSDPTRAEATAVVILAKPTLSSISIPSKHVNGTDLTITGVTNVAETNSKYDVGEQNMVYLNITDLNDNLKCGRTFMGIIGKDKTFSIKIDNFGAQPPCVLETGYYKANFTLVTDTGLTDEEVTVFELVNGMVKIMPDKTTVVRGDKVKFTIITNLKVNNPVYFTIEDQRIIGGTGSATETLRVDATGKAYKEITVSQTAPLTEYRFRAVIAGDVSDTITISVVKQTIDLNADKTTVARGGEIRFTGTTTADEVYVFASEPGVFKDVTEVPSDTTFAPTNAMKKFLPDTNDRLDFKLEVLTTADAGTYYLYFYAPANTSMIDRASDPQKMFAIVVTDPRITKVEIPSVIPYQGKVEVTITADPGKRENARLTWVLEGSNIKARPTDFGRGDIYYSLDSNNEVKFYLDLKDYRSGSRVIDPGLYVFTVKLYLDSEEVDKVQKLVEISAVSLDVTIEPSVIVIGDQIKVTVQSNREGVAGYDHIFVTMVGANYKAVQRVTLDSTGKGSVTFETLGIADGTYKIYVRDTMNTSTADYPELYVAEELYDLDPADATARVARAHDDILVIRTIQILKEKPTPTPTTPPPTTPPVTTPAVTPTTPPPTTPPVTTPPPTTTPAPGPIPGFEAIFAIAGLVAIAYLLRRRQ
ncbi:MAG: PGF-CTERM sorting domain-containing protein [Archaeoglobales archaeon]|nr:PGF-CTERM sorting domain-containing protein [Archaeoglobales archaeon]